jgi:hypothetical protein
MSLAAIIDSWEEKIDTLEEKIRLQNINHGLDLLEMQLEIERVGTRQNNPFSVYEVRRPLFGMTWD